MKLTAFMLMAASCAALAATEEQINKQFDAKPDGKVVVEVDFGSITVTNCGSDHVTVDAWRKITRKNKKTEESFLKENPVEILQEGNTVTIRAHRKSNESIRLNFFSKNREDARYTIGIPSKFNTELTTAGGSIKIIGIAGVNHAQTSGGGLHFEQLKGKLNANTSGGSIHVADCEGDINVSTSGGGINVSGGGGTLDGDTSGGSVKVSNFKGPAHVGTSGGGISLENVAGKIDAGTSGGSINATLVSPLPDTVNLETSGGGITINVAADASFYLDATTSGGGVSCELPILLKDKRDPGKLQGSINGGEKKVSAHTSGGGIHVKKQ